MPELPDAKKWFTGFFDITRWIKDGGILLRIVGILGVCYLLYVGGTALWRKMVPPKPVPRIVETVNSTNGKVEVVNEKKIEKKIKFGLINLW